MTTVFFLFVEIYFWVLLEMGLFDVNSTLISRHKQNSMLKYFAVLLPVEKWKTIFHGVRSICEVILLHRHNKLINIEIYFTEKRKNSILAWTKLTDFDFHVKNFLFYWNHIWISAPWHTLLGISIFILKGLQIKNWLLLTKIIVHAKI